MWVVMDQVSYQFQPRSLAGYVKCYEMLYELQIDAWRSELMSTPTANSPGILGNIVELTHLEGQQLEALPYAPQLPVWTTPDFGCPGWPQTLSARLARTKKPPLGRPGKLRV